MARTPTFKPTTAPPRATLVIAPIPAPPLGLTQEEIEKWNHLHRFKSSVLSSFEQNIRNTVHAIRAHLQPPGTQTAHLKTLTWLYYNQHVAGSNEHYKTEFCLDSRLSKGYRIEDNLHLATIGARPETRGKKAKARWNEYLGELGLPQGREVGTGLPDHLRCRDPEAARILMSMSNAAAMPAAVTPSLGVPPVVAPPVNPVAVAETAGSGAATRGEAGPSTAAFRAGEATVTGTEGTETTSRAAHEEAATRLASVQETMDGATAENDEELFLALQFRRNSIPRHPYETEDEAMTRLAVQFLGSEPFATARDALIELVRAGWDLEAALNNWSPDQPEEGDRDDEDQPPSKRQRLSDDDDDGGEDHGRQGKGKGKQRAD